MAVLVTGASGMLGAQLARLLCEQGYTVRALTRKPLQHPLLKGLFIEEFLGDLSDRETLGVALDGCDQVYHVAGLVSHSNRDWERLRQVNVEGTRNILELSANTGIKRLVLTSSISAVALDASDGEPFTEKARFLDRYQRIPYMATKHEAEKLALNYPGLNVIVVNPGTIYGEGDVKLNTGVVFQKILQGKLNMIPPGGTAVVSVKDCARGHLLAMKNGEPGQRYILTTANHSYEEIFTSIAAALDVQPPQKTIPRWVRPIGVAGAWMGELFLRSSLSRHVVNFSFRNRFFSSQKAREALFWEPEQTLDEMMREAAEFYQAHQLI